MTFSHAALRASLGLQPMTEFEPDRPARLYDLLNEEFLAWNPADAACYRDWARPYVGAPDLINYDCLELLGWQPN
jgi:hypothetical protein